MSHPEAPPAAIDCQLVLTPAELRCLVWLLIKRADESYAEYAPRTGVATEQALLRRIFAAWAELRRRERALARAGRPPARLDGPAPTTTLKASDGAPPR